MADRAMLRRGQPSDAGATARSTAGRELLSLGDCGARSANATLGHLQKRQNPYVHQPRSRRLDCLSRQFREQGNPRPRRGQRREPASASPGSASALRLGGLPGPCARIYRKISSPTAAGRRRPQRIGRLNFRRRWRLPSATAIGCSVLEVRLCHLEMPPALWEILPVSHPL